MFFNLIWNYLRHGIHTTSQTAGGGGSLSNKASDNASINVSKWMVRKHCQSFILLLLIVETHWSATFLKVCIKIHSAVDNQSIFLFKQNTRENDWFIYFPVSYAPFQSKLPYHGCSSASTIPTESLWAPVCGILSKGNLTVRIYQVLQQVAQLITKAVWTALSDDTALNHLNLRKNSGELLQRLIQCLHWGLWMKHDGHEGI